MLHPKYWNCISESLKLTHWVQLPRFWYQRGRGRRGWVCRGGSEGRGQSLACARHSPFHLYPTTGGTWCHLWGKRFHERERKRIKRAWQIIKKIYGGQGRRIKNFIMNYLSTVVWEGFVLQQLDIHEGTMSWWKDNAKAEEQADEEGEAEGNCYVLTVTHTKCRASLCSGCWGQREEKSWEKVLI